MPLIFVKKEVPFDNCTQCSVSPLSWRKDGIYCVLFGQKTEIGKVVPGRCQICKDSEVKE